MLTFDGGSREACQPRRFATNTPLQALAILNDPVFTECARALAERATREAPDRDARIARAFRLACSRAPRAGSRARRPRAPSSTSGPSSRAASTSPSRARPRAPSCA
jgi:hypothetical protein